MLITVVYRQTLSSTCASTISQHDGCVRTALKQKSVRPPLVWLHAYQGLLCFVPDTRVRPRCQSLCSDAVALGTFPACRLAIVNEDLSPINGDIQSIPRAVIRGSIAVHHDIGDCEPRRRLLCVYEVVEASEVKVAEPGISGPGGNEDCITVTFPSEASAGARRTQANAEILDAHFGWLDWWSEGD